MPCCRAACLISSRLSAFQSHDRWTGCETRQRHKPSNVPRTCLLITVPTAVCFLLPFLPPHWQHRRTVCLSWRVRGVAWASFITGFGINKKIFTRFVAHQKKISYFFSSANDITAIQEKVSTTTWDCFFFMILLEKVEKSNSSHPLNCVSGCSCQGLLPFCCCSQLRLKLGKKLEQLAFRKGQFKINVLPCKGISFYYPA